MEGGFLFFFFPRGCRIFIGSINECNGMYILLSVCLNYCLFSSFVLRTARWSSNRPPCIFWMREKKSSSGTVGA